MDVDIIQQKSGGTASAMHVDILYVMAKSKYKNMQVQDL